MKIVFTSNVSHMLVFFESNLSVPIRPGASIAARYFAERAAADQLAATAEARRLTLETMSGAHRYFDVKTTEEAHAHAAEDKEMVEAPRTAAIENSALRGMEEEGRRRRGAMDDEVGAPAPAAIKLFSDKTDAERTRKAEEITAAARCSCRLQGRRRTHSAVPHGRQPLRRHHGPAAADGGAGTRPAGAAARPGRQAAVGRGQEDQPRERAGGKDEAGPGGGQSRQRGEGPRERAASWRMPAQAPSPPWIATMMYTRGRHCTYR